MDAITLLRDDHTKVKTLFKRFTTSDERQRGALVQQLISELSVHAAIEEQIFYPLVRGKVPKLSGKIFESLEEHHVMKWILSELEGMKPSDQRFNAKVKVLIESVRNHIDEEEAVVFPALKKVLEAKELREIGTIMGSAKKGAPTRPHPRAPDTPPANIIAGAGVALIDKARHAASDLLKSVTSKQAGNEDREAVGSAARTRRGARKARPITPAVRTKRTVRTTGSRRRRKR